MTTCQHCGQETRNLNYHWLWKHCRDGMSFTCPCGQVFHAGELARRDMYGHAQTCEAIEEHLMLLRLAR